MLYVLFGDDEFSRYEALAAMKAAVTPEEMRDANISELDGAALTLDQLAQACFAVPFMANKRLVSVDGLLSRFETRGRGGARGSTGRGRRGAATQWDGLEELIQNLPPSTDLVFVDGPLRESNPLFGKVRPHAECRPFRTPSGAALRNWIAERAAAQGMAIDGDAVAQLEQSVGGNLRAIAGELDKLALYRWRETVTREDVRRAVVYNRDANIFAAVDAVIEGRAEVALGQILRSMDSGAAPSFVLAMLTRQVRNLLLAKEMRSRGARPQEMARALRVPEFAVRRLQGQERRLSFGQLAAMHRELLETDESIKRGQLGERAAVELLAASLVSVSRARARR